MISTRTKDALAGLRAQRKKLGGLRPKRMQAADARAEDLRPVLAGLRDLSANAKARELNARGVATPTGRPWSAVMVIRVMKRLGLEG